MPVGNRYYYRTFVVLREGNKGYQNMVGKSPMGYCKMEFRGTRGRIVLTVQNLKPLDQGSYSCMLVSREDGIVKTYDFGTLKLDRRGRGETVWEFDQRELEGLDVSEYKAVCVAYIPPAARKNTDIHFPLVGYSEKGMSLSWESDIAEKVYASKFPSSVQAEGEDAEEGLSVGLPESLREEKPKKEKDENIPPKLPPKEEKKEENIPPKLPPKEEKEEEKKEENIPPKLPEDKKEKAPDEKKEENIPPKLPPKEEKKEEKKEENIPPKLPEDKKEKAPEGKKEENLPPKLPPKEEKKEEEKEEKKEDLPPKKEKKRDYWDNVKDYFEHLFNTQPKIQPFEQEIPNSEWIQIQYGPHYPSPYGSDGYMYGYVQPYGGYNYYIVGLIRENDRVKYICYGMPGPYSILPPAGWQGFSGWLPANGYYGTGYWMMYLDAETGQTVYRT